MQFCVYRLSAIFRESNKDKLLKKCRLRLYHSLLPLSSLFSAPNPQKQMGIPLRIGDISSIPVHFCRSGKSGGITWVSGDEEKGAGKKEKTGGAAEKRHSKEWQDRKMAQQHWPSLLKTRPTPPYVGLFHAGSRMRNWYLSGCNGLNQSFIPAFANASSCWTPEASL